MAIPFNLPSDEETEDDYRRLDQLLQDLYHVLRQILLRPRYVTTPRSSSETQSRPGSGTAPSRSGPVADVTSSRRLGLDLPDVVSSTLPQPAACQCPARRRPQRRHRRRRPCCSEPLESSSSGVPRPVENWLVIGEQLRRIAEEFKTTFSKQDTPKEKEESVKMEVKTTGLFSLLVPGHLRSSIWTTVILLVGWRLLVRGR